MRVCLCFCIGRGGGDAWGWQETCCLFVDWKSLCRHVRHYYDKVDQCFLTGTSHRARVAVSSKVSGVAVTNGRPFSKGVAVWRALWASRIRWPGLVETGGARCRKTRTYTRHSHPFVLASYQSWNPLTRFGLKVLWKGKGHVFQIWHTVAKRVEWFKNGENCGWNISGGVFMFHATRHSNAAQTWKIDTLRLSRVCLFAAVTILAGEVRRGSPLAPSFYDTRAHSWSTMRHS